MEAYIMNDEKILEHMGPCGLRCDKCFAFTKGVIAQDARQLVEHLGNFDVYARRFSNFMPVFENYPQFKEMLHYFAQPGCRGCRAGDCLYPNCGVAPCHKEKGVDFCFQCGEFPCDKTNFDAHLHARWIEMNERMKEIGVEAYYNETTDKPRYV